MIKAAIPTEVSSREVSQDTTHRFAYSFCTLVTEPAEYREMIEAFAAKGFTSVDCEFLHVDNSRENRLDAYAGYNRFLREAQGRYVILCHQDVLPIHDDRERLDALLDELTQRDPDWGVCGNAGATASGKIAARISDPNTGDTNQGGPFPVRVVSLDENFLVVRTEANLALSHDLTGYHWYGADLCIIADVLGWNAYVIDFHVLHKSGGSPDGRFADIRFDMRRKYGRAFRSRWHHVTTKRSIFLSGSPVRALLARTFPVNWAWRKLRRY